MTLPVTPSQTIGPFFAVGLIWADGPEVVPEGTRGAVRIGGRVLEGAGDASAAGVSGLSVVGVAAS